MIRAVLLAALLAGTLAELPARAAGVAVDAGSLRARIDGDPWHLVFTDPAGAALSEAASADHGSPGQLGFRAGAGWTRATRVLKSGTRGRRAKLVAETSDPGGTRLAVDLRVDGEGVIALTMRPLKEPPNTVALGVGFYAEAGERFFGFGERATGVEHRGRVVENYVSDGPYQPAERPVVRLFVPPPGFRDRDDATYFPVPWLLSSRGLGVLVDNAETSYFRLGTDDPGRWSLEVTGAPSGNAPLPPPSLRFRVFAGPLPGDVLRRFTHAIGRQPPPAAPWVLGPWIQLTGSLRERTAQLRKLEAADAPLSVVQTYTHYLPCGDQVDHRDAEQALVKAMHDAGAAVTTYFNPMVCASYAAAFAPATGAGALTRDATGAPYVYDYTGTTVFRVGQFDFANPAGRRLYRKLLRAAIADGHDGWMEDFGEYTPLDAFDVRGRTGTAYHDVYPVQYHCAADDAVRRLRMPIVRFQRSGWTGVAPCAQVVWGGDPTTGWGFDGLTSALHSGLGMGLSGIAVWGSDIGGFFALGDNALTPELLMRWVQFGAVSGVMRTESNGFALPAKTRPQVFDDAQLANWKRHAKLRTQLEPYISAALAEYRRSGMPLMRHLALVDPDDPVAVASDDEFLFGPDVLAAPVLTPGATTRDVYLPRGGWVDLWRSGAWDSVAGAFVLGDARILDGSRSVTVPAPIDQLPLLIRAGAVLPLLPADVDTLADYGTPRDGFVRLLDRKDEMHLLAFPRGRSVAALSEHGEEVRSEEDAGGWSLVVDARRAHTWHLESSLATLQTPFVPCAVDWNGHELLASAWSYDPGSRVLRATFRGRAGRLSVRGCG